MCNAAKERPMVPAPTKAIRSSAVSHLVHFFQLSINEHMAIAKDSDAQCQCPAKLDSLLVLDVRNLPASGSRVFNCSSAIIQQLQESPSEGKNMLTDDEEGERHVGLRRKTPGRRYSLIEELAIDMWTVSTDRLSCSLAFGCVIQR